MTTRRVSYAVSEEEAWFVEPARREPIHHSTRLDPGCLPKRSRETPPPISDDCGSTRNLDRHGQATYGGGKQILGKASDKVFAARVGMGGADRHGLVKRSEY